MGRAIGSIAAGRRLTLAAVVTVGAVVALGAFIALRGSGDGDPTERAVAVLGSEARFDSSKEAVASFALVYQHLAEATERFPKDCSAPTGKGRCLALNQAAGWSLSFSPLSGHCTQPAIQRGRLALLGYLRQSRALAGEASEPPALPPFPTC